MKMTSQERKIVEEFKRKIHNEFPGEIRKVLVFGSKARGDALKSSDIDILVITSFHDWKRGDKIRSIGYELDPYSMYSLSIHVISEEHADYLELHGFQFMSNIAEISIAI